MKKILVLLCTCVLFGSVVFAGFANAGQEQTDKGAETIAAGDESAETEDTGTEYTREDIEESIIGTWMLAERDGKPALTNEKGVFTFVSPEKAYISAAFNSRPELGSPWVKLLKADVAITGSKVTLTWPVNEGTIMVDELTITNITDTDRQGRLVVKSVHDGEETIIKEGTIRLEKVNYDYSNDIIGTWEGRCTSEGSIFDDGQDHRWEYKDDDTYVYYMKDGGQWVPGDDTTNEYFVDGNLLCTRWIENDVENREWWEIIIDGDTMNWTALREDEDGNIFTASFEMTKVAE